MRNMAIDMGNTRIKAGLFSDHKMLKVLIDLDKGDLLKLVAAERIDRIIASSVASDLDGIEKETGLVNVLKLSPELEGTNKKCLPNTKYAGDGSAFWSNRGLSIISRVKLFSY